ncbi:MAG: glycosyltransferase family 4 protein [Candidatus Buchananbacteria bacterium]|nr:glycosyltransferase family 4 protein [Candidatus Buchananbacteria bacterium]
MKIIIASGTYKPEISGQSTFISNLISALKKVEPSFDVSVVTYSDSKPAEAEDKIYRVPRNLFRHFSYFLQIKKLLNQDSIIYAQDLFSSGLPSALAKMKKKKLVIRLGGDFLWEKMVNSGKIKVPLSQYYQLKKTFVEKFYLFLYRFVLKRADLLIFNTLWQKNFYQSIFNLSADHLAVIENPFPTIGSAVIDQDQQYNQAIVFAGRFIKLKNLTSLVDVFRKIKTDKKLILIGEGPEKINLQNRAAGDNRIEFIDSKGREELLKILASSYLVVLPSLSELNPNLAMECLGLKKPMVLTSEVGFRPEIKKSFKLVDPTSQEQIKQAIEFFLVPDNYNLFVENLQSTEISKYSWDDLAKKHIDFFSNL